MPRDYTLLPVASLDHTHARYNPWGLTPHQCCALRLACSSHCTNLRNELRNANADVKRFREAASCERDVRLELEKQVGTLQAEVRRQHEEIEALKASQQECGFGAGCCYQSARSEADEVLLWLARELIRELPIVHPQQGPRREELIEALNKRLSNA